MLRNPRESILLWRHWLLVVVRIVAFVMGLLGVIAFCNAVLVAMMSGNIDTLFSRWDRDWNRFAFAISMLGPAIALILLDRRIVRWLIPVPKPECPQCGYAIKQLTTTRCPECGYEGIEPQQPIEKRS